MIYKLNDIRRLTREENRLIHAITNPISINQCANAVLCVGARPIMAENPKEVSDITATAGALLINLGNITDIRMEAMERAAQTALENNVPVVLDAVGVACSELRRSFALRFAEEFPVTILKGNYSEITALFDTSYKSAGIDANSETDEREVSGMTVELAKRYGCTVLASGKTDIVTDVSKLYYVRNGTEQLSRVTGTGCMLGALCACYASACPEVSAAVCAAAVMGICGEISGTDRGNGSFMVNLLDALSVLSDETLINKIKTEENDVKEI